MIIELIVVGVLAFLGGIYTEDRYGSKVVAVEASVKADLAKLEPAKASQNTGAGQAVRLPAGIAVAS